MGYSFAKKGEGWVASADATQYPFTRSGDFPDLRRDHFVVLLDLSQFRRTPPMGRPPVPALVLEALVLQVLEVARAQVQAHHRTGIVVRLGIVGRVLLDQTRGFELEHLVGHPGRVTCLDDASL